MHTSYHIGGVKIIVLFAVDFRFIGYDFLLKSRTRNTRLEHRTAGECSDCCTVVHRRIFVFGKFDIVRAVFAVPVQIVCRIACRRKYRKILDRQHYNCTCFTVLTVIFLSRFLACLLCRFDIFFKRFYSGFLQFWINCKVDRVTRFCTLGFNAFNKSSVGISLNNPCSALAFEVIFTGKFNSEFAYLIIIGIALALFFQLIVFIFRQRTECAEDVRCKVRVRSTSCEIGLNFNTAHTLSIFADGIHGTSADIFGKNIMVWIWILFKFHIVMNWNERCFLTYT